MVGRVSFAMAWIQALIWVASLRLAWAGMRAIQRGQLRRRVVFRQRLPSVWFRGVAFAVLVVVFVLGVSRPTALVPGLLGLVLLPLFWSIFLGALARRRREILERAGLAYFHALRGLVHSGLGLPSALFHLARSHPTLFARQMSESLEGFEEGKGLEICLQHFQKRVPLPALSACLGSLQLAYQRGAAVAPLLDRVVPLLERERERTARLRDLRRSALAQAGIAFAVPWILLATLYGFSPSALELKWGLCAGALGVEILGVLCLIKASAF